MSNKSLFTSIASSSPLVSVVLAVYNGENFIAEAIESILSQSYSNFEFIIINDGSTDRTDLIIAQYKDFRIKYIIQNNIGLATSLNNGIRQAKGKYIARQDHDDISFKKRLEKQVDFLEKNLNYALLGTRAEIIDNNNNFIRIHEHPLSDNDLKFFLTLNNPFVHSSVMIRRAALDQLGLYLTDPKLQPPEDYELWSRISEKYKIANLEEILLKYRSLPNCISKNKSSIIKRNVIHIAVKNMRKAIKENPSDLELAARCFNDNIQFQSNNLKKILNILNQLRYKYSPSKKNWNNIQIFIHKKIRLHYRHHYGFLIGILLFYLHYLKYNLFEAQNVKNPCRRTFQKP